MPVRTQEGAFLVAAASKMSPIRTGPDPDERHRTAACWIPALAYMALIWSLSSIPKTLPVEIVRFQDKWLHLIEYSVLAALYCFAIARSKPAWSRSSIFALACLLAAMWGIVDEIHQSFVPNRYADVYDALADAIGAIAGASVYFGFLTFRDRNR